MFHEGTYGGGRLYTGYRACSFAIRLAFTFDCAHGPEDVKCC